MRIYKIEFGDYIYYGSTKQMLCQRQSRHNCNLRDLTMKQNLYVKAREYGIKKLILIQIDECDEKDTPLIEERYIISPITKIVLNTRIPNSCRERKNKINREYKRNLKVILL